MAELVAMEIVYAEYFEKVRGYIASHIENTHDREDIVQEVFLKIHAKLDTFDGSRASISTWIYTITRNTVIDYHRRARPQLPLPDSLSDEDEETLDDEMLECLADALTKLGERERDIIILHYYNRYTLKRIAEMMNISYIYAKVLHKKAIGELKVKLEGNK